MSRRLFSVFVSLGLSIIVSNVSAQTPELPPGPIYIVQDGDTLWDISNLFNVSMNELITYNNIAGEAIFVGDKLVIPGMEELSGILNIQPVPLGETLRSLIRQNKADEITLITLNRIVSPGELYAGYRMILLQQEIPDSTGGRNSLRHDETLLELAVRQNTQPWSIVKVNGLDHTTIALPGDIFYIPGNQTASLLGGFPPTIVHAALEPLPISQGQTAQVKVTTTGDVRLTGTMANYPLNFFVTADNTWVALQGVHAMSPPGLHSFTLIASMPDGTSQSFEQLILIEDGFFPQDPILLVEPSTIDPAITEPEEDFIYSVIAPATIEKYWQGKFFLPVDSEFCIRSQYGNRRSYNNSDFIYFHTGIDYGICSETHPFDIYAPASGTVVFTGNLAVRGNATIIDHGWGIYSGLYHQEEIYVEIGDFVKAGELVGIIGDTGRVTGPHLHWEVWVNGVQVNPLQWLEEEFPHE